ncbi:MAG: ADP-ribosylglycohydrolase family protein [Synergistaceae bacterium]|nr:ADP-ribosylglycohydrolase family protein [Synergistaceae bacterium]
MRAFGRKYPRAGYGRFFKAWIFSDNPQPYNAFTNGAAMKISPVAWWFDDLLTVEKFAGITAGVTHSHPEGIKGAQSTASAIFLARTGKSKDDIRGYITARYGYDLSRTIDEIRPGYRFDTSCQGSVPEAITAFLDSVSFEDAIRNAVSLGGDADTLAAIAGSIAEGFYGVPAEIESQVKHLFDAFISSEIERWNKALNGEDVSEPSQQKGATAMIPGAIIGDIIGSVYEFDNIKSKDFPLISERSTPTDDSCMTMAIAHALMKWKKGSAIDPAEFQQAVTDSMREFGKAYPRASYGGRFREWLFSPDPKPYNSWGNGSAMRVSPVAWWFDDLQSVEKYAEITALPTHNHPEGIKGAQATAAAVFLARTGKSKDDIRSYISIRYGYDLSRTCDGIRPDYDFDESCQGTVPEAIIAFLESDSFEDAIRNAISLGGDSDTIACITGAIAEGFYGVPEEISSLVRPVIDDFMMSELERWSKALKGENVAGDSQPVKKSSNGITEMVFILDRSGSMTGLEDDTIGGFNSMIAEQKQQPGEAFVSTVLFDHEINVIHDRMKLADIPELTRKEYFTRGNTALLDAMGRAIDHIIRVHRHMNPKEVPGNVVFVIITDGMENASCEYSGQRVKEMVEREKTQYGWDFIFIGANMDAIAAAGRVGISAAMSVNYRSDRKGTGTVFRSMSRAMRAKRMTSDIPEDWSAEIRADFDDDDRS